MADLALYYEATPPAYVATQSKSRGLILTQGGAGEFEFPITGIVVGDSDASLCGFPTGVGVLDEFASLKTEFSSPEELDTDYINTGVSIRESLDVLRQGLSPLRTLYVSDVFGREVAGGKTIYSVELATNCTEVIYLGIASKANIKEDMIFRGWHRVLPNFNRVRPIVSGLEFRILLYTKGAGRFVVYSMTAWAKLTDRRGFNASPRSVKE